MGKTEEVIMEYLSQPDIIADLFNGYVFCGKQIIQPDMLKEVDRKGRLLLEDGKGQKNTYEVIKKERDIVREVTIDNKKLRLMICGVEQQTNVDYSMPFTENGNALKQYVSKHEDVYSHIDSATSRVLSMLLDLDLSVQSEDK